MRRTVSLAALVVALVLLTTSLTTAAAVAGAELKPLPAEMPAETAEWLPALFTAQLVQCTALVQQVASSEAEPCFVPNSDDVAFLQGGRFRVHACLRTEEGGEQRSARLFLITRQSGLFWFFNQDNVEIVVKVLDACIEPFNRFWFFAAGLTNVEVTLTVVDSFTEETKVYQSPLGMPFQPILDTNAFATCP